MKPWIAGLLVMLGACGDEAHFGEANATQLSRALHAGRGDDAWYAVNLATEAIDQVPWGCASVTTEGTITTVDFAPCDDATFHVAGTVMIDNAPGRDGYRADLPTSMTFDGVVRDDLLSDDATYDITVSGTATVTGLLSPSSTLDAALTVALGEVAVTSDVHRTYDADADVGQATSSIEVERLGSASVEALWDSYRGRYVLDGADELVIETGEAEGSAPCVVYTIDGAPGDLCFE